jgi:CHASE2 domain-containing sensor protein
MELLAFIICIGCETLLSYALLIVGIIIHQPWYRLIPIMVVSIVATGILAYAFKTYKSGVR